MRLRHHLQKDKKNYLRKAYSLLNLVFPEYTDLIKSPFKKVSLMILKKHPTAYIPPFFGLYSNIITGPIPGGQVIMILKGFSFNLRKNKF